MDLIPLDAETVQSTTTTSAGRLENFRPPPLPSWAEPHAATALTASKLSLSLVERGSSLGFSFAKGATSFGFDVARLFLAPIGAVADHALGTDATGFGGGTIAQSLKGGLNGAETLAQLGISLGREITGGVLTTALSTVSSLNTIYGNDEALRALGAFLRLVKTEYSTSLPTDPFPEGGISRFSTLEVSTAAATWAAIQSITGALYGRQIAGELEELDSTVWGKQEVEDQGAMIWEITDEQLLEGGEELIEASVTGDGQTRTERLSEDEKTRDYIRRYSKLCLGSYGGMGMIFFGVKLPSLNPFTPSTTSQSSTPLTPDALSTLGRQLDEESLANAFRNQDNPVASAAIEADGTVDETEAELGGIESGWTDPDFEEVREEIPVEKPGLWSILTGRHDVNVLESLAGIQSGSAKIGTHDDADSSDDDDSTDVHHPLSTADRLRAKSIRERAQRVKRLAAKKRRRSPRFFIITDHCTRKVLLCLRGTFSVDDAATDLACEPAEFDSGLYWDQDGNGGGGGEKYAVHGGMFEVAVAMGCREGPVTRAVGKAMRSNPDYDLHLVGHSLGAGAAALLGIMWANPTTCLTSTRSGLPIGRRVKVYGFAPPCTMDSRLSPLCHDLCHSFIFSTDAVPRFSLGHIRDIRSAVAWLCFAGGEKPEEGCRSILARIIAFKRGKWDEDLPKKEVELAWFESLRKTLEANMVYADLFPPGEIFWLVRPDDLLLPPSPASSPPSSSMGKGKQEVPGARLFRVTGKPEVVFGQMLFGKQMLSSHLPHAYMGAVADYF